MTAAFPVDHLDGLGETFKWSATLSIGGTDVRALGRAATSCTRGRGPSLNL